LCSREGERGQGRGMYMEREGEERMRDNGCNKRGKRRRKRMKGRRSREGRGKKMLGKSEEKGTEMGRGKKNKGRRWRTFFKHPSFFYDC